MGELKRITPEAVKAAYEKTGLSLTRGGYFMHTTAGASCACGLGAYAAANLGIDPRDGLTETKIGQAFCDAGFNDFYRNGFAGGFDGRPIFEFNVLRTNGDFIAGYADGKAAWESVKEAAHD